MRKLRLDVDIPTDLTPIIDHWCKWCEQVHEFQLQLELQVYRSMRDCEGFVTFVQLCVEGRLIESKWRGIRR